LIPGDFQPPSGGLRRSEPTAPENADDSAASFRGLRFLIVDDTDELRELMARMVERAGHAVEEAADGVEATVALASRRYDVMLLDLSMPRMSGQDVVRWLHAHPDRAVGMRTVIVTAWGGENRGTLQELGITDLLAKPFRLRQLMDLIADVTADLEAEAGAGAPAIG
jgi:CheY-like chemotaxis protein